MIRRGSAILLGLALVASCLGSVAPVSTRAAGANGLHGLRVARVPEQQLTLPRRTWGGRTLVGQPVGVDDSGRVWEWFSLADCCNWIGRYDPARQKLLPGLARVGLFGAYVSPDGTAWWILPHMSTQGVVHSRFVRRLKGSFLGFNRRGIYSDVALDPSGGAWIPGWSSSDYRLSGPHLRGLAGDVPPGHAVMFYAGPASHHLRQVPVPAPGPLTGATVAGRGIVWTVDPYLVCPRVSGRKVCRAARLIRLDFKTRRVTEFLFPLSWGLTSAAGYLPTTPIAASPDGSVWLDLPSAHGYRLLQFSRGEFAWYSEWRARQDPLVDGKGEVWLLGGNGHPVVLDPKTGTAATLPVQGGRLFRAPNGTIWYVQTAS